MDKNFNCSGKIAVIITDDFNKLMTRTSDYLWYEVQIGAIGEKMVDERMPYNKYYLLASMPNIFIKIEGQRYKVDVYGTCNKFHSIPLYKQLNCETVKYWDEWGNRDSAKCENAGCWKEEVRAEYEKEAEWFYINDIMDALEEESKFDYRTYYEKWFKNIEPIFNRFNSQEEYWEWAEEDNWKRKEEMIIDIVKQLRAKYSEEIVQDLIRRCMFDQYVEGVL